MHATCDVDDNASFSRYLREERIEERDYQKKIAEKCTTENSLVVMPTGLGKTLIAVYVTARMLELSSSDSKIVVLAPTRPLLDQHYNSFNKFLTISDDESVVLTGKVNPEKRTGLYQQKKILFYTPQTLRNDLAKRRYSLDKARLVIFDEAHHATGEYAYTLIADEYIDQNPTGIILGLTASPGSSKTKIQTLCKNLHVPIQNIYARTREDKDVKRYIKPLDVYKVGVDLTELMREAYDGVITLLEERLQYLSNVNLLSKNGQNLHEQVIRKDLLKLNAHLVSRIKGEGDKTGAYTALSINAQGLILYHMLELIEQQGLDVLLTYLEKMRKDSLKKNSSKAVRVLAADARLKFVYTQLVKLEQLSPEKLIHPKFYILRRLLEDEIAVNPDSRILVFVKLRDSVKNIANRLMMSGSIKVERFVGQSTKSKEDKGLTQKKQLEILDLFKQGKLNCLISTNVAEEGLDIAECDLVVFYDVVASEIRFIQREGRTGRHRKGRVIILYCRDTHDEIYLRIALMNMKRMNINLRGNNLGKNNKSKEPRQNNLRMDRFFHSEKQENSGITINPDTLEHFNLRQYFHDNGMVYQVKQTEMHIDISGKIAIFSYPPETLRTVLEEFDTQLIKSYELMILVLDFSDFKRTENHLREMIAKYDPIAKQMGIQLVSIDHPEELHFMLKNLYSRYNEVK